MSIIASSIINRAKVIWQDANLETFSEVNALLWLTDALSEARGGRTDAKLNDNGELTDPLEVTAQTDVIPMHVKFRPALVDYVVSRGFEGDGDSQKHAELAIKYAESFLKRLVTA
jgi:hypothetical protein